MLTIKTYYTLTRNNFDYETLLISEQFELKEPKINLASSQNSCSYDPNCYLAMNTWSSDVGWPTDVGSLIPLEWGEY